MEDGIKPSLNIRLVSFFVAFRDLAANDLIKLPPDIFNSLTLLTSLYVFSLLVETPFAFFFFSLTSVQLNVARWSLFLSMDELNL